MQVASSLLSTVPKEGGTDVKYYYSGILFGLVYFCYILMNITLNLLNSTCILGISAFIGTEY